MSRKAFTLIELLLASTLAAVLMAGVLLILAGVSRDRRRFATAESPPQPYAMLDRIGWDLANAQSFSQSTDGRTLRLIGHGGIDQATLRANGRLVSVAYRVDGDGIRACLIREQLYLDDPAGPKHWRDLVSVGCTAIWVNAGTAQPVPLDSQEIPAMLRVGPSYRMPDHVNLRIDSTAGQIDREMVIR